MNITPTPNIDHLVTEFRDAVGDLESTLSRFCAPPSFDTIRSAVTARESAVARLYEADAAPVVHSLTQEFMLRSRLWSILSDGDDAPLDDVLTALLAARRAVRTAVADHRKAALQGRLWPASEVPR